MSVALATLVLLGAFGLWAYVSRVGPVEARSRFASLRKKAASSRVVNEDEQARQKAQRQVYRANASAARTSRDEARRDAHVQARRPLSQQAGAKQEGGGIVCPKCKGGQFKARRSKGARAGIVGVTLVTGGIGGLAGVAATKQRKVECVTCGTMYNRG